VLLFIVLIAATAVRVWRSPVERRAFGRTRIAPSSA